MKIGYGRISVRDATISNQKCVLENAGCEKIYFDVVSSAKTTRPELVKAQKNICEGDVFTIASLDCLGRSVKDLLKWIGWFEENGIIFKSLQENIDTSRPSGKIVFHVFSSVAEFERNLTQERKRAGLASDDAQGKVSGKKVLDEVKARALQGLFETKEHSVSELCEIFDLSKDALYDYLRVDC